MAKPLLLILLAALSAAFAASALLQQTRAHCDEQRRRNAQPSAFFVNVVEPSMKLESLEQASSDVFGGPAKSPTTVPATQPTP